MTLRLWLGHEWLICPDHRMTAQGHGASLSEGESLGAGAGVYEVLTRRKSAKTAEEKYLVLQYFLKLSYQAV